MEKIGICDWGIGGIGMLQHLRQLGDYDIVYLSDAGFSPYGKVSETDLSTRWLAVKNFFLSKGVTKIAVACNALSTVVEQDENFITVVDSGVAMASETDYKIIGITGGYRTIESNAYLMPLQGQGFEVLQSVGQVLSARVEAGDLISPETIADIQTVFTPLLTCQAVILACTHYPVLAQEINKAFPSLVLLDPALKMASKVAAQWAEELVIPQIEWNTTGDIETMKVSARICFNEKIENPIKVIL